jgi:hypothetical protein
MKSFTCNAGLISVGSTGEYFGPWIKASGYKKALMQVWAVGSSPDADLSIQATSDVVAGVPNGTYGINITGDVSTGGVAGWYNLDTTNTTIGMGVEYIRLRVESNNGSGLYWAFLLLEDEI